MNLLIKAILFLLGSEYGVVGKTQVQPVALLYHGGHLPVICFLMYETEAIRTELTGLPQMNQKWIKHFRRV